MTMRSLARGAAVIALVFAAAASAGSVPQILTQQGRLLNSNGTPATGTVTLAFSIYDTSIATVPLWTETQQTTLVDGYFVVQLGRNAVFPATVWTGATRFLGLKVGVDAEMTPRQEMTSIPYALRANDAIGDIHPTTVSVNGMVIIDATGTWVGPSTGLAGPQGPAGAPGAVGPAGPAGSVGAAGPAGAVGPAGPPGAQGNSGPAGAVGAIGPPGPQGPAGAVGATGAIGPAGPAGPAGPQGNQGNTGPAGVAGAIGPQGAQGPAGVAGAMGPQGPQGAQGPAGVAGPIGPQGAQGVPGATGATGAVGATGATGATGPSGIANCAWVTSAGQSLGGAIDSTITDSVSCPAGRTVHSGGCEGYTSVAICRSNRVGTTGWECWSRRISGIGNANVLTTSALCCQ